MTYESSPPRALSVMWREGEKFAALAERYDAASPAEREAVAAQHPEDAGKLRWGVITRERTEYLKARGFAPSEFVQLTFLSEHIWRQVETCIEAGQIKPPPLVT